MGSSLAQMLTTLLVISKARDPEVMTTSTVMSLKCPLSTLRMSLPCRSSTCSHNQCFDATSFLQVQEQAPQWSCPICNKTFPFDNLIVDQYVQDILHRVSSNVEQVTIEPNGTWRPVGKSEEAQNKTGKIPKAEPNDDLIELAPFRPNGYQSSAPASALGPPHMNGISPREVSSSAGPASRSTPGKRKAEEVVDLTLSSDEDEP